MHETSNEKQTAREKQQLFAVDKKVLEKSGMKTWHTENL